MTGQVSDRGRRIVSACAALLVIALVGSIATLPFNGPGTATNVDAGLYVLGSLAGIALLGLRAAWVRIERATWLCFAGLLLCNMVAVVLWSFGFDQSDLSPTDGVWGLGYVLGFVGVVLYLRHRVGDAYRAFWID